MASVPFAERECTFGSCDSPNRKQQTAAGLRVRKQHPVQMAMLLSNRSSRLAVFKLSRVPPGTQSRAINSKISSLIAGMRSGKISALTLLARHMFAR